MNAVYLLKGHPVVEQRVFTKRARQHSAVKRPHVSSGVEMTTFFKFSVPARVLLRDSFIASCSHRPKTAALFQPIKPASFLI